MWGNSLVQFLFLREGVSAMKLPYPTLTNETDPFDTTQDKGSESLSYIPLQAMDKKDQIKI